MGSKKHQLVSLHHVSQAESISQYFVKQLTVFCLSIALVGAGLDYTFWNSNVIDQCNNVGGYLGC